MEDLNTCAFCGKPTRFQEDRFCSYLCELDHNEPQKPATARQAAIIKIDKNGDYSYHN